MSYIWYLIIDVGDKEVRAWSGLIPAAEIELESTQVSGIGHVGISNSLFHSVCRRKKSRRSGDELNEGKLKGHDHATKHQQTIK